MLKIIKKGMKQTFTKMVRKKRYCIDRLYLLVLGMTLHIFYIKINKNLLRIKIGTTTFSVMTLGIKVLFTKLSEYDTLHK
jgi:hypothetical protein